MRGPLLLLVLTTPAVCALAAEPAARGDGVVLTGEDYWRKHYTFFPPRLSAAAAAAAGVETDPPAREKYLSRFYHPGFRTPPPPAGWARRDFDDADWLLRRGREFVVGDSRLIARASPAATSAYLRGTDPFVEEVGLVCQRGTFLVKDPSKVRKLSLTLTYRGGFVARLNGREIARGHLPTRRRQAGLPRGKIAFDAPAADYPLEAFFVRDPKTGALAGLHAFHHKSSPQWALRERSAGPIEIDPALLVKGRNVLAIELHRADYPAECRRKKINWRTPRSLGWATVGLSLLRLAAEAEAGAVAPGPRRRTGVQAWTAGVHRAVSSLTCPNHDEGLTAVRIVAARNGAFAGQVLVAAEKPLEGLSVRPSALKHASGRGAIPPAAVSVRYSAVNPLWPGGLGYRTAVLGRGMKIERSLGQRLDLLLDRPPAGASAVGVWVTVRVPPDCPPGRYAGAVAIQVKAHPPIRAPIELDVADWTLPDVDDFTSLINIYQSPDTLARYYKLTPFSPEHWRMIERSMKLMARAGNIGLFVPLLAESQMGNPESMVVWIPKGDGSYGYDFSAFDRYIDTAMKHHTRLKFISLNVWGYQCRGRKGAPAYGAQVTVLDPATGARRNMKLPAYGSGECEKLLRPLLLAIKQRLARRGLEGRMLLGLPADGSPSWQHVAMLRRILPATAWIRESHYNVNGFRYDPHDKAAVVEVAYNSIVWGGGVPPPAAKRLCGWRYNPRHIIMTFNRAGASALNLHGFARPWSFRAWMESTLAGGRNGNGRVGGDYWRIGMRPRGPGRVSSEAGGGCGGTLFGSYLPSSVGQVGLGNSTSDLFGPAPKGPVATIRFENALEGNQQAEARIFIERALLDEQRPLPEALAGKCRTLLDERTTVLRMMPIGAGRIAPYQWPQRTKRLYEAAAEVHNALRAGH